MGANRVKPKASEDGSGGAPTGGARTGVAGDGGARTADPAGAAVPARYSRQVLFEGIGVEGQARLIASRAVLVGCGALGTVQASLLARAGVGTLRIIDRDFVEESNLQRQILFDEEDVKGLLPKAVAAEKKLRAVNSQVRVEGVVEDLNPSSVERLLTGFDLILDATDNFDARFLMNDFAVRTGTPWVYGACVGSYGLTFPILPDETACLRCVFETAPPPGLSPTCDTAGVLGPIVGIVASLQAAEALKILSGRRDRVSRKMNIIDVWEGRQSQVDLPPRDPGCPACGRREFTWLEGREGADTTTLCGRNAVQIRRKDRSALDLEEVARRLAPLGGVERNRFLVRAQIDNHQITVFADGRAIIGGTNDPNLARSIYARYVGN